MYVEFVHNKIKLLVIIMSEAELTHVKSFSRGYHEYLDSWLPNVNEYIFVLENLRCIVMS